LVCLIIDALAQITAVIIGAIWFSRNYTWDFYMIERAKVVYVKDMDLIDALSYGWRSSNND
jgi:hypothetical protein